MIDPADLIITLDNKLNGFNYVNEPEIVIPNIRYISYINDRKLFKVKNLCPLIDLPDNMVDVGMAKDFMKFLKKAYTHTNNLNELLNDLIDISMIESGEMKMNYGYFEIVPFLEKIIHEFNDKAKEKGIEIRFNESGNKIKYYCDKDKLRQVMVNLISNSIKYTDGGYVEVDLSDEEKFGIITVSDSGIGIPEKDIDRIFERFYRVDKDRSRTVGGTGLGLAIVKHIVEAHGSTVDVESEYKVGTKFSFKLKKQFTV